MVDPTGRKIVIYIEVFDMLYLIVSQSQYESVIGQPFMAKMRLGVSLVNSITMYY